MPRGLPLGRDVSLDVQSRRMHAHRREDVLFHVARIRLAGLRFDDEAEQRVADVRV